MMMPDCPVAELAEANEFVLLVERYRNGTESITRVIECLRAHESDCGVELIAPGLPYTVIYPDVDSSAIVVRGDARFEHLVDLPDEPSLGQVFAAIERGEELPSARSDAWDEMEAQLSPFLSRTWALLWASHPDDCDLSVDDTYFVHATARAYGALYARWANNTTWLGLQGWEYTHFYYSMGLTEDFYQWLQTLHAVVVEKTRQRASAG